MKPDARLAGLPADPELVAAIAAIAPYPSPCSPWCDVWRDDPNPGKWRTCTHRRRP